MSFKEKNQSDKKQEEFQNETLQLKNTLQRKNQEILALERVVSDLQATQEGQLNVLGVVLNSLKATTSMMPFLKECRRASVSMLKIKT